MVVLIILSPDYMDRRDYWCKDDIIAANLFVKYALRSNKGKINVVSRPSLRPRKIQQLVRF